MRFGVVLTSDDYARLYATATLISTLVARGDEVHVFVTGTAVRAFAKNYSPPDADYVKRARELNVDWRTLWGAAKSLGGLKVMVCETAIRVFGVPEEELDRELVDEVGSMYAFLERVGDGQLVME